MGKTNTRKQPTTEQLAALKDYAEWAGEGWKRQLQSDWLRAGSAWPGEWALLQQLRNQFGPSWLWRTSSSLGENDDMTKPAAAPLDPKRPHRVGDGVTYHIGSDSYPATVVAVSKSGHQVTITRDRCKPMSHIKDNGLGHRFTEADAVFVVDRGAEHEVFTRRVSRRDYRTGKTVLAYAWVAKGQTCGHLTVGRSHYMDPSF
jgi:hypothetical protein